MSLSTMDDFLIDNLSFWFDELDDFDTSIPYLPDELTGSLLPVPEDPIASLGAPAPTRKPVAVWKPDADRDHRICIESSQMVPDERWRDDNKLLEPISERETCKLTPEKETEEEPPGKDSIGRAKGKRAGRRPEKSRGTGLWRRGEIGNTDIAWRNMERQCSHCRVKKTPQWRTGPRSTTLCNACGMRYKSGRLVPEYRPAASPSFDTMRHSNFHKKILKLRSMRY